MREQIKQLSKNIEGISPEEAAISDLSNGFAQSALIIIGENKFTDTQIQKIVTKAATNFFNEGTTNFSGFNQIKELLIALNNRIKIDYSNEDLKNAVKASVQKSLEVGYPKNFIELALKEGILVKEDFKSSEFSEYIFKCCINGIDTLGLEWLKENDLIFDEKILKSKEIEDAAYSSLKKRISLGHNIASLLKKNLIPQGRINSEEIQDLALNVFNKSLNETGIISVHFRYQECLEIIQSNIIPREKLDLEKFKDRFLKYMSHRAKNGIKDFKYPVETMKEVEKLNLVNKEEINLIILPVVENGLLSDDYDEFDNTLEFINLNLVSKKELKPVCKTAFDQTEVFVKKLLINESIGGTFDKILSRTYKIFDKLSTEEQYKLIKEILEGRISEDAKKLGVKQTGEAGITQLEQGFQKFKGDILKEDFNPEFLNQSLLMKDFFKLYVRYDETEFQQEGHGDENFNGIIENAINKKLKGETNVPLNPNFIPSDELQIQTVDKDAQKEFEWSEQFCSRYKTLTLDILEAQKLYKENFPISKLLKLIEDKLVKITKNLELKQKSVKDIRGAESLKKRIEVLRNINLRSLVNFEQNFSMLVQNKEIAQELRQLIFLITFAKNKNLNEKNISIDLELPNIEDISFVLNFVDHITNQETMSKYFSDKHTRLGFNELIQTRALKEELFIAQNKDAKGTKSFQFVPTRGLLMEFSGHIADACWAEEHKDMAKEFPNFTTIIMVQNRNTKHERLAGASLLIETKSDDGKDLLIIRGLNPLENIINELKVSDFYDKFIIYCKTLAEKSNRKLAIVIDDCGMASTNRPVLFEHILSKVNNLSQIKVLNDETNFNGYNITDSTYLID